MSSVISTNTKRTPGQLYYNKKLKNFIYFNDSGKCVRFDFSDLPPDCYTYAYIPICKVISPGEETGAEEKFGGTLCLSDPTSDADTENLQFLCQFKDPRTTAATAAADTIYQVFIDIDDMDACVKKISSTGENHKTITRVCDYSDAELKPYKIVGWNKSRELVSFDKLKKRFKFSAEAEEILHDMYYDSPYFPSMGIKVGGTPMSTQSCNYDNMDLLQLAQEKILDFEWGDAGIAHVSADLKFKWDCC